jgi:hypothetical protein
MICNDSNLDLDQFKNTAYVPRGIRLSGRDENIALEWNWLKQKRKRWGRERPPTCISKPDLHFKKESPQIAPGAFFDCSHRYWLSSGMVL